MVATIISLFVLSIVDVFTIIVLDCLRGRTITDMNKITDEDIKKKKTNRILKLETASAWVESAAFLSIIVLFVICMIYKG